MKSLLLNCRRFVVSKTGDIAYEGSTICFEGFNNQLYTINAITDTHIHWQAHHKGYTGKTKIEHFNKSFIVK